MIGLIAGCLGWTLSWYLATNPLLAPFGFARSVVVLWVVIIAGIVVTGAIYTAPTVRRNRIWLVWGALNASAVGINIAAIAGWFPGPVANTPVVSTLLGLGWWRPWFLALGIGYLVTGFYNRSNPQIRKDERTIYVLSGVACLAVLSPWLSVELFGPRLFVVGGLLHVVPIGFDVFSDIALIIRQMS